MSAAPAIKGWCPGAWRPMRSGDGLIVRIRPRSGRLSLAQAAVLAQLAREHGDGELDLTRRANIQLRAIRDRDLETLHRALDVAGLLDPDPAREAHRNILVDPFEGLAGTPPALDLAEALDEALAARRDLADLPSKFGFAVDPSPMPMLTGDPADIRLEGHPTAGLLLVLDGDEAGLPVSRHQAPDIAAIIAARFAAHPDVASGQVRRMRHLTDRSLADDLGTERVTRATPSTLPPVGRHAAGLLVAPPFGRLGAPQLADLAAAASEERLTELRLTPWRQVFMPDGNKALVDACATLGLATAPVHPLLGIEACTGAPGCASASIETRSLARRLAPLLAPRRHHRPRLHVSGCAKGCASRSAADVTLVGRDGAIDIVLAGAVTDRPARTGVSPDRVADLLPSLLRITEPS